MAFISTQEGNLKTQVFITESELVDMFVGNTLFSYGNNGVGGFGDGTLVSSDIPVQEMSKSHGWTQISYNGGTSAAIGNDGYGSQLNGFLWMWGFNGNGQLGDGTTVDKSSPVQTIAGGLDWKSVSVGQSHTTSIKTDGTLWVWGDNAAGQLGNNSTTNTSVPTQLLGREILEGVVTQVAASGFSGAAIKNDNTLWVWGLTGSSSNVPIQNVMGGTDWSQTSGGFYHTAAIKLDGTLWLWGNDNYGQLGDGSNSYPPSPVQTIAGGTNWKQVSCGYQHTAAVKTDGTLWMWGRNDLGQLGDDSTTHKSSPVQTIATGTDWSQVACGRHYTAAIKTDGTLWMWGQDNYGQLGDADIANKSSPGQTVAGGTNWSQVAANGGRHGAAIKNDGTLWTWGFNSSGQLGNGTGISAGSPAQTISGGTNWSQVSCGYNNTMAIKADGTLWVWGDNTGGYLGDGSNTNRSSPIQTIIGGTTWQAVSCGGTGNTLAVKTDGSIWSWGWNGNGQLGNGTTTPTTAPAHNAPTPTWLHSSGGYLHTAAIKPDHSLWVWGNNTYGQLGNGTTASESNPIQTTAGGTNWKQVSCGYHHTAAIHLDGSLWTWGENSAGQLGNGTTVNTSNPIQTIGGGNNWKFVVCGHHHTAAIKNDGTLWLWGDNTAGQLGDGTTVGTSSPTQTILGGFTWKAVACGTDHTAAVKTDGTTWAWGNNFNGQLGNGVTVNSSAPVQNTMGGHNWKQVTCGGDITGAITFADI
jgi:alpha-tubulin suppressor-like RCC1 family protein